ncbi:NACHT domain-containing protein [Halpernia frigidisoli]|uniref:Nephrocystin 3-like N-terminal domain-containing protein n=1 Tax=Halpernia frigidisoli TaxID=1125876 RepID=A0A1I3D582_9FLAO|nr:ATP-binding protein [Halpernia frigidisoli]SFH81845.1 hypothetical protein SAMN05443292_0266 [Halpernia frigidisoli]
MKQLGEISAIVGYNKQFEVCAIEIYEELLNNNLEWIEFASATAGKIDDVLIGCKDYIKAFQVKDVSSNLTYSNLTTPKKNAGKSIIEGCFEGWKNLKGEYSEVILAKYISNEKASTKDKIDLYKGDIKPSFSNFLDCFWNYLKSYPLDTLEENWIPVFNNLKDMCHAEDEEFIHFIKSFTFVTDNEYNVQEKIYDYNSFQREKDIDKISKNIFKLIGTKGNKKYNKRELLSEFNLLERYETYFQHSFFVDEEHYQPITETLRELNDVIDKNTKGYIAIIGNAGSGKSTLLTKWIDVDRDRVLKYYAYVNSEMDYDFGYRGEAKIFLKDLLIQIRENSFSIQKELPAENLEELQKQLSNELKNLQNDGKKTYIIVDGLDHIEREQNVTKSLLEILPNPENIPDNVYFILGSRTIVNLDNLPDKIKLSLKNNNSIVFIKPLTIQQIKNITDSYDIELEEYQLTELKDNTLGHPLFLRYTIEELIKIPVEKYEEFISQKSFSGDIYDEYNIFWNKYNLEEKFTDILGIISRFRYSYIDINLLPLFQNDKSVLQKIKNLSEHYFYKNGNIWQFFHNSFKEFLKEKTSENFLLEEYDEKINIDFHKKIYEVTKNINSDYKYNILFHLYHAKDYQLLVESSNQSFFREQWFEFRNYKKILEDIKLSAESSYFVNDTVALMDYFLSYSEISQRGNNFHISNYYSIFLKVGKIDIANSFIFNNFELLVSKTKALDYAIELFKVGNIELSQYLLKKAEPDYILNISKRVSPNRNDRNELTDTDEVELVVKWAVLSCIYFPIDEILDRIKVIQVEVEEYGRKERRNIVHETLDQLKNLIFEIGDKQKLKELNQSLERITDLDMFYFYYDVVFELEPEEELYQTSLSKLINWDETQNNSKNRRLSIIEAIINKDIAKSLEYFNKLITPLEIIADKVNTEYLSRDYLLYIYDYSRLYYIGTKEFSVESKVLIPKNEKSIVSSFYNEFAELGKCYAYLYYDNPDASKGFIFRINQILGYFHHQITDYEYEYTIQENKVNLVSLIIRNSEWISQNFLQDILELVSNEWANNNKFWKDDEKQKIIDVVIDFDTENIWCVNELNKIDDYIFDSVDNYAQIENGVKQIELWSKLEMINEAYKILEQLMEVSFSIKYEKDYQLDYLLNWNLKNEMIEIQEIGFIIKSLKSISYSTNYANKTPAEEILKSLCSFGNGFEVFKYLLFEGQVNFGTSLNISLNYLLNKLPSQKTLIVKIFSRIILNFDDGNSATSDFIKTMFNNEIDENIVKTLINEIKIYSIVEKRTDYLIELKKYCNDRNMPLENLELDYSEKAKDRYSSNDDYQNLKLKDGRSLQKSEVSDIAISFDELINLMENENSNSYFKWSEILNGVLPVLTLQQIEIIIEKKSFDSVELTSIAQGIYNHFGDKIYVKSLIQKALDKSKTSGWQVYYDGGSIIKPLELLKIVDDSEAHIAFKKFAENIEFVNFGNGFSNNIDDIFKIFDNDFTYNKYHPVISEYLKELLKNSYRNTDIPDLEGNLEPEDFLLKTIQFLFEFPSYFDEILIEILAEELVQIKSIVTQILAFLNKSKMEWQYISLLATISLVDVEFTRNYQNGILNIYNHPRFDLHLIAERILDRLNFDYASLNRPNTLKIPLTYTIELNYKPELVISDKIRMKRLDQTGYLRNTNDPLEYCHLYLNEISKISRESGFEKVNIAYRIMNLGNSNFTQPSWYRGLSEKEIRDIYEYKFDLKISYKRPQYQKVWCGLMMVLKELLDLEIISYELAFVIGDNFDESISQIQVQPKPLFIPSILKKDDYAPYAEVGWVDKLDNEYLTKNTIFNVSENLFILEENTFIEGQGDGLTLERRQAFVDFNEFKNNLQYTLIFNSSNKRHILDYESIQIQSLCFFNWSWYSFNKKINWLAFNPMIAHDLGLKLSATGNFRWLDENGITVIESIFWKSNDLSNKSRNLHSESGYGWYVTITNDGISRLKNIGINTLYQHTKIFRTMKFKQRNYGTEIDEENSEFDIRIISL